MFLNKHFIINKDKTKFILMSDFRNKKKNFINNVFCNNVDKTKKVVYTKFFYKNNLLQFLKGIKIFNN